jgi:hypothetical protein
MAPRARMRSQGARRGCLIRHGGRCWQRSLVRTWTKRGCDGREWAARTQLRPPPAVRARWSSGPGCLRVPAVSGNRCDRSCDSVRAEPGGIAGRRRPRPTDLEPAVLSVLGVAPGDEPAPGRAELPGHLHRGPAHRTSRTPSPTPPSSNCAGAGSSSDSPWSCRDLSWSGTVIRRWPTRSAPPASAATGATPTALSPTVWTTTRSSNAPLRRSLANIALIRDDTLNIRRPCCSLAAVSGAHQYQQGRLPRTPAEVCHVKAH